MKFNDLSDLGLRVKLLAENLEGSKGTSAYILNEVINIGVMSLRSYFIANDVYENFQSDDIESQRLNVSEDVQLKLRLAFQAIAAVIFNFDCEVSEAAKYQDLKHTASSENTIALIESILFSVNSYKVNGPNAKIRCFAYTEELVSRHCIL